MIGEQHAFSGDPIDVGGLSHHTMRVRSDIPRADIVAEDRKNVGFLVRGERGHHYGERHEGECRELRQAQRVCEPTPPDAAW
jgi:hypothetical protein